MSMIEPKFSEMAPKIKELADQCVANDAINPELYAKYDVKRGLRDVSGRGVTTGLTQIAEVHSYTIRDSEYVPCEGKLFYRGYDVEDLVKDLRANDRFGFEEIAYLLILGNLPNQKQLDEFKQILSENSTLPTSFVRDVIMKAPSRDIMNSLARSVLTMYSYDANADDVSPENVMRQVIKLVALAPSLAVYSYQAFKHYHDDGDFVIRAPLAEYSIAQNILYLLRPDGKFSDFEAKILDLALILHADHGGGNNSTFTMRVVTSTGTDTYAATSASLAALKGPRHGGANIKVVRMFEDMKDKVSDWSSEEEVGGYLKAILHKEAFDRAGLIYGMGHAVYSISDPRARVFKSFVKQLSKEKGREKEFALYDLVERLAPQVIANERKIYKGVSANVDFYSGFVYDMLGLPMELYTPIFAVARVAGWGAHRLEELVNASKVIRPAYKNIGGRQPYVELDCR